MTTIRKYTNKIEEFLHSENGQRFFNIAYSVGAAIVIWGALFKILHLPGGNTLLCIGMGTEIAMFILTAFDRPPKEPNWEELVPALNGGKGAESVESLTIVDDMGRIEGQPSPQGSNGGAISGGGTVVIGGAGGNGNIVLGPGADLTEDMNKAAEELSKITELAEATNRFVDAIDNISKQMSQLNETMSAGSGGYAERMSELNRNLSGLNTIYEIQLRSVSGQLEAIDRVNKGLRDIRDMYEKSAKDSERYCEETEKMTTYMKQINDVYARMIAAMSIQAPVMMNHTAHSTETGGLNGMHHRDHANERHNASVQENL